MDRIKERLHEDLIEMFAQYQWRLENPIPSTDETQEKIIYRYRTDFVFSSKVRSLADGVMFLVEKNLVESHPGGLGGE